MKLIKSLNTRALVNAMNFIREPLGVRITRKCHFQESFTCEPNHARQVLAALAVLAGEEMPL